MSHFFPVSLIAMVTSFKYDDSRWISSNTTLLCGKGRGEGGSEEEGKEGGKEGGEGEIVEVCTQGPEQLPY